MSKRASRTGTTKPCGTCGKDIYELEAEIALLRKVVMAAETMRYSNTAKAVRAFDAALAAWKDER